METMKLILYKFDLDLNFQVTLYQKFEEDGQNKYSLSFPSQWHKIQFSWQFNSVQPKNNSIKDIYRVSKLNRNAN